MEDCALTPCAEVEDAFVGVAGALEKVCFILDISLDDLFGCSEDLMEVCLEGEVDVLCTDPP